MEALKALTHGRRHYSTLRVELLDKDGNMHIAEWSGKRWFRVGNPKAYFDNFALTRSFNFNGTQGLDKILKEGPFKTGENLKTLFMQNTENGHVNSCDEEILDGGWWFGIDRNIATKNNTCPVHSNLNAKIPFYEGVPNIKATWVKFRA